MAKVRFENAVCVCVRECGHAFRTHGESEVQVSGTFTSVGDLIEAKMDTDPPVCIDDDSRHDCGRLSRGNCYPRVDDFALPRTKQEQYKASGSGWRGPSDF